MHALVRRLRGATAVALSWAVGWTLVGTLLGLVIRVIRPQDFDPGESVAGIAGLFATTTIARARRAARREEAVP